MTRHRPADAPSRPPRQVRAGDRLRHLPRALAAIQVLDVVGNALLPDERIEAHLDHLGVPVGIRPLLSPIKLASSVGLVLGHRMPAMGACTSAGLVAYYSIAAGLHLRAGDPPVLTTPAVLSAAAATACTGVFLAALRSQAK